MTHAWPFRTNHTAPYRTDRTAADPGAAAAAGAHRCAAGTICGRGQRRRLAVPGGRCVVLLVVAAVKGWHVPAGPGEACGTRGVPRAYVVKGRAAPQRHPIHDTHAHARARAHTHSLTQARTHAQAGQACGVPYSVYTAPHPTPASPGGQSTYQLLDVGWRAKRQRLACCQYMTLTQAGTSRPSSTPAAGPPPRLYPCPGRPRRRLAGACADGAGKAVLRPRAAGPGGAGQGRGHQSSAACQPQPRPRPRPSTCRPRASPVAPSTAARQQQAGGAAAAAAAAARGGRGRPAAAAAGASRRPAACGAL